MQEIVELYHLVSGGYPYMGLFFVSLLFAFFAFKKTRELWFYPNIFILLILFNPMLMSILGRYFLTGGTIGTAWRIWWIIPIPFLIAMMFTEFLDFVRGKEKIFMVTLICLTIVMSGRFIFNEHNFTRTENVFQMPNDIIEISKMISEDSVSHDEIEQNVVAVYSVAWRLRMYNPEIMMHYGRRHSGIRINSELIFYAINSHIYDFEVTNYLLKEAGVSHLVIYEWQIYSLTEYAITPKQLGYDLIGYTQYYRVYRTNF